MPQDPLQQLQARIRLQQLLSNPPLQQPGPSMSIGPGGAGMQPSAGDLSPMQRHQARMGPREDLVQLNSPEQMLAKALFGQPALPADFNLEEFLRRMKHQPANPGAEPVMQRPMSDQGRAISDAQGVTDQGMAMGDTIDMVGAPAMLALGGARKMGQEALERSASRPMIPRSPSTRSPTQFDAPIGPRPAPTAPSEDEAWKLGQEYAGWRNKRAAAQRNPSLHLDSPYGPEGLPARSRAEAHALRRGPAVGEEGEVALKTDLFNGIDVGGRLPAVKQNLSDEWLRQWSPTNPDRPISPYQAKENLRFDQAHHPQHAERINPQKAYDVLRNRYARNQSRAATIPGEYHPPPVRDEMSGVGAQFPDPRGRADAMESAPHTNPTTELGWKVYKDVYGATPPYPEMKGGGFVTPNVGRTLPQPHQPMQMTDPSALQNHPVLREQSTPFGTKPHEPMSGVGDRSGMFGRSRERRGLMGAEMRAPQPEFGPINVDAPNPTDKTPIRMDSRLKPQPVMPQAAPAPMKAGVDDSLPPVQPQEWSRKDLTGQSQAMMNQQPTPRLRTPTPANAKVQMGGSKQWAEGQSIGAPPTTPGGTIYAPDMKLFSANTGNRFVPKPQMGAPGQSLPGVPNVDAQLARLLRAALAGSGVGGGIAIGSALGPQGGSLPSLATGTSTVAPQMRPWASPNY